MTTHLLGRIGTVMDQTYRERVLWGQMEWWLRLELSFAMKVGIGICFCFSFLIFPNNLTCAYRRVSLLLNIEAPTRSGLKLPEATSVPAPGDYEEDDFRRRCCSSPSLRAANLSLSCTKETPRANRNATPQLCII